MGTAERRQRERDAKRALILDAARELFVERGYEAVTLREVARRIEHSTTAIYVHFRDKRALLEELVAGDFAAFAAQLRQHAGIADPVQRLRRAGQAYVEFGVSLPNHYRLLFMTERPHGQVHPREHPGAPDPDGYTFLLSTVTDCIASGRLRPEYEDPFLVAQMLWAAVHGVVSLHITHGRTEDLDLRPPRQLADALIECLLQRLLR
jgi:AcrR family transcriptional regulator